MWVIGIGVVAFDEEVWSHFRREAARLINRSRNNRGEQQRGRIKRGLHGRVAHPKLKWAICEMVK